jgi:hypothetical protein
MGFVGAEDLTGQIELVLFPKIWKEVSKWLALEQIVVIYGKADTQGGGNPKILVDNLRQDFKIAVGRPAAATTGPSPAQAIMWTPDTFPAPVRDEEGPRDWAPPPPDDDWMTDDTAVQTAPGTPSETPPAPQAVAETAAAAQASKAVAGTGNGNGHGPRNGDGAPPRASVPAQPEPSRLAPSESAAPPRRPTLAQIPSNDEGGRRVVITLTNSGDKDRDLRLLKRVHGLLTASPGSDRFEFQIREGARHYQLRFPNHTTGLSTELAGQLTSLLGPDSIAVQK